MGTILEIIQAILAGCWIFIVTVASVIVIITEVIPAVGDEWRKVVIALVTLLATIGAVTVIVPLLLKEEKTSKR